MQKLASKLVEVMRSCKYVTKNELNTFHKYRYATSADVLEKVNSALTKQGIATVVLPEIVKDEVVTTSKGNAEHLVTVKIEITLIDKDSGETATFRGFGSGQDASDKAIMKAQTAALKYAYMLSLAIATGDDPEADSKTDENMSTEKPEVKQNPKSKINSIPVQIKIPKGGYRCYDCGAKISEKVAEFSRQRFGKCFCMECQKNKSSA